MLDLRQLLRVRSASAGRSDAAGRRLVFVSDLGLVPQVWGTHLSGGWPELLVAPPDRAQTVHVGPLPGQLVVGADVGGKERTWRTRCPGCATRGEPIRGGRRSTAAATAASWSF